MYNNTLYIYYYMYRVSSEMYLTFSSVQLARFYHMQSVFKHSWTSCCKVMTDYCKLWWKCFAVSLYISRLDTL